jgi:tripartite-type tricarboxylate transporter receptor subunit TctC
MNAFKRCAVAVVAAIAGGLPLGGAVAADFPSRRIEIVATVTPGSATDILARLLAEKLAARLGQPAIVTNKPGANQQIGAEYVHRAPADGHTLLVTHSGIMANPFLVKAWTLDLTKDLTPIAQLASTPWVFAVPQDFPAKNMAEFVAYSKANPAKVNYGTTGGTSILDLSSLKAKSGAGGEILTYPGGTQVMTALVSNEIQGGLNSIRGVNSLKGRVRALAVTSAERSSLAPEIPTIAESGVPGYSGAPLSYGVWGPPDMPDAVLQKVNAEINAILALPEVRKHIMETMACEIIGGTPRDYKQAIRGELDYYSRAARDAKLEPK